jgi:hypothetical protein
MARVLRIATEFSEMPGPRYKVEGDFSGELFRENHLEPLYLKCKEQGDTLLVDLDNTEGYATSFIEESFGGLKRRYPNDNVLDVISIKCDDEPFLKDEVSKCVEEALDPR